MSLEQLQAKLTAKIWQSIAQSGIDVSAVAQDDMNKLVDIVVAATLEEVDAELGREQKTRLQSSENTAFAVEADADDDDPEVVLWEGRPFLSLVVNYVITNERIRIIEGLIGKDYEDIELVRVQDVDFKQTMTERMMSIGDITISSHDPSHPTAVLRNIPNPKDVHEVLRRAVIKARKKYRLSYREEM